MLGGHLVEQHPPSDRTKMPYFSARSVCPFSLIRDTVRPEEELANQCINNFIIHAWNTYIILKISFAFRSCVFIRPLEFQTHYLLIALSKCLQFDLYSILCNRCKILQRMPEMFYLPIYAFLNAGFY